MKTQLKRKANFLDQGGLKTVDVGVTCERYSIINCIERQADPIILEKRKKEMDTAKVVEDIQKKYSK